MHGRKGERPAGEGKVCGSCPVPSERHLAGTILWVEKNKTQRFRSTLEMLKLMDEVLSADDQSLEISFLAEEEGKN